MRQWSVIKRTLSIAVAILISSLLFSGTARAYPDAEIVWDYAGAPPFDFGVTSTPAGFVLMSDTEVAIAYGKVLKLVDTGSFALETDQPFDLSSDDDTNSIIRGIGYVPSTSEIVLSQESGTVLVFPLSDITAKPNFLVVDEASVLGPIAVDSANRTVYVADNTARLIHIVDLLSMTVTSSITLTISGITSFEVTDAHFVTETSESYFTTDQGAVFYIPVGATAATLIDVDVHNKVNLVALDQLTGGGTLYVIDTTNAEARKIDTSSHTVDATIIDLSPNSDFTDIKITQVTNPAGTYAYVPGASGMTVINTGSDTVIDFDSDAVANGEPMLLSATPSLVQASSLSDAFVYTFFQVGGFGVISENPFVDISSVTYSDGESSMGQGESVDVTFAADTDGTYEIRVGGSVDASGDLLVDSAGASSGSVTADTDLTVTINYDDNSSLFAEGNNAIWVFVTSGDLRGRLSTEVTVDTPPPDVVISSTGFGTEKVYVNFERIDVEDMATYNVYADTDPDAVLTKADASTTVSQPDSGSGLTATVEGLANSNLYYFAMDAVDANGNISPNRTSTYADGTRVTGMPEATEGPAGISGEKGCDLGAGGGSARTRFLLPFLMFLTVSMLLIRRARALVVPAVLLVALMLPSVSFAQQTGVVEGDIPPAWDYLKEETSFWTVEAKTGFWMPSSKALDPFYSNCCNMWTRLQVGYLWQRNYGAEFGVGFHYKSGKAIGTSSGSTSQESYSFLLIPVEASFVWRADYFPNWRYLIPYMKAGLDGIIYRERSSGNVVKGIKWGVSGVGGVQLNIGMLGDARMSLKQIGINDFFFTLEGEYQWVNNFGAKGLDLSGPILSFGFLFYF